MSEGSLAGKLIEPKVVKVGKQWEIDDGEGDVSAVEEETLSFICSGASAHGLPVSYRDPRLGSR